MIQFRHVCSLLAILALAACGREGSDSPPAPEPAAEPAAEASSDWTQITPGLDMRIIETGSGETAKAGQVATVHYTGWLHDPESPDGRGNKFDSSVDRGQYFEFPLGAGRVIRGWDEGVVGMRVGETRELRIAPEMAYGDRQVGALIPPGSTLLFEVELAGLDGEVPGQD
ncbi:MAG: FKBP-type peptidyl-prolyl cis-trans isomerase [Woeseiaceae bacterium]|nr:FKBP-type peptidyl-prolyl cis-trans isomerase [Woeseiaceae bacterium]